jgi:hypothetical protein
MPDETTADQSESLAATEDAGDNGAERGSDKAARRARRDFDEFAFRELRRARKLFTATDEVSEAQFAVQMAHVAALLGVADAIRSTRGDGGSPDA